jgi:hypothetical protein
MPLLTALDPTLLIYSPAALNWSTETNTSRLDALLLHRRMMRKYGLKLVMSAPLAAVIQTAFPWNADARGVPAWRDLRTFLLRDLEQALYVELVENRTVELLPEEATCSAEGSATALATWRQLLGAFVEGATANGWRPHVGSSSEVSGSHGSVLVRVEDVAGEVVAEATVPVLKNESDWGQHLASHDWWPDVARCVELHFLASPALQTHNTRREQPFDLEVSTGFQRSLRRHCQSTDLRRAVIEALTKVAWGINDEGLGLEWMDTTLRFRVTLYWRIHASLSGTLLTLEQFGPHDMGIHP